MKRKTVVISLLVLLVISSTFPFVGSTDSINEDGDIEALSDDEFKSFNEKALDDNEYVHRGQYWEFPVMDEHALPTGQESYPPRKLKIVDLPDEYSWTDFNGEDWTSPINDQSSCGSCWLFAAIGCLESIINVREGSPNLDLDLSEQYVMSCLPSAGSCRGGVARSAWRLINSTSTTTGNGINGILPEKCFGYQGIDKKGRDFTNSYFREVLCEYKCEDWVDHLIPAVTNHGYYRVDGSAENITRIKTDCISFGPIVTSIAVSPSFGNWYRTHNDPNDYYPHEDYHDVNHNVVIVGWKDDPMIPSGGYWKIKNTWGTTGGYKGFFNIAYGSLHIDEEAIQWVDYDPENYTFKPIVKTNGPYNVGVGDIITFDGSDSFGPESEIISYTWDFGDGATSTDVIVEHAYTQPGSYMVTLTVEDDLGIIVTGETAALIDLWEVGDSWTYNVDEIIISTQNLEFQIDAQTNMALNFDIEGAIEDLNFMVSEITDEYYVFNFEGNLNGKIHIKIFKVFTDQFFNPGVMLTRGGEISGQIKLNKTTFGMDNITIRLNGRIMPMLGRIPIPIPLPFDITLMNEFVGGFKLLDFPLSVGKKWDLRGVRGHTIPFTMRSKFESNDPNIMKIVENILESMGVPLAMYMRITGRSDIFECVNKESITTNLGTYECYNIAFGVYEDVLFNYYFAPELGGIVKISGDTGDFHIPAGTDGGIMSFKLNGELISTNYQN